MQCDVTIIIILISFDLCIWEEAIQSVSIYLCVPKCLDYYFNRQNGDKKYKILL